MRAIFFRAAMVAGLSFAPLGTAQADDAVAGASLSLAPENADFYFGVYNGDKQWQALLDGPVVTSLLELPVVQENWKVFLKEWDDPNSKLATARFAADSPVLQDILKFANELISKDAFIWGDSGFSRWTKASTEISDTFATNFVGDELAEEVQHEILDRIASELKTGPLPSILMGGKFESDYDAISKVDQLEMLLGFGKQASPEAGEFIKKVKRVDDERGSRLVVELNGKMIPWDLLESVDFSPEVKKKLRSIIQDQTIAVVLGMLDGYFVFSIAPTVASVMDLNSGSHLNANRDIQPALKQKGRELSFLAYASDALNKANFEANVKNVISKNITVFSNTLQAREELSDGQLDFLQQVEKEGKRLNAQLMDLVPEPRGGLQFGWLTDTGFENFSYSRTPAALLDGSRKLALLERVGSEPVLAVVTNSRKRPDIATFIADLASTARQLILKAKELNVVDEDKEEFTQFVEGLETVWPSLEKLSSVYRTKIEPAVDGEGAFALTSGHIQSKQWIADTPESSVPLPIYEAGLVWKLNDPKLLRAGVDEGRSIINQLLEQLRSKYPKAFRSKVELPAPVEVESNLGTKFIYSVPAELNLPESLVPQAIYTADSLILTYSDEQAKELASKTKLSFGQGIVDQNVPYANVSYVDIGKSLSVLRPWLQYAAEVATERNGTDLDANQIDTREAIGADLTLTINDLLSVWEVLQKTGTFTSTATLDENNGVVSRSVYTQSSSK